MDMFVVLMKLVNQLNTLKLLSPSVTNATVENSIENSKHLYGTPFRNVLLKNFGATPSFDMPQSTREQQYALLHPEVKADKLIKFRYSNAAQENSSWLAIAQFIDDYT